MFETPQQRREKYLLAATNARRIAELARAQGESGAEACERYLRLEADYLLLADEASGLGNAQPERDIDPVCLSPRSIYPDEADQGPVYSFKLPPSRETKRAEAPAKKPQSQAGLSVTGVALVFCAATAVMIPMLQGILWEQHGSWIPMSVSYGLTMIGLDHPHIAMAGAQQTLDWLLDQTPLSGAFGGIAFLFSLLRL